MKRKIFYSIIFFVFSLSMFAQAPQKFKFQAVARDASGIPYASENLAVRVSLVRDGISGLIDYAERHQVTTSPLGVFDLEIGGGVPLSGEMADTDWANHPYYLKIDIDPDGGTSYLNLGTSQLLSVPYAIYAGQAGNGGGGGDPTDELQNLIYDPVSQTLTLTDGNAVTLSFPAGADNQTLSLSGTTLSIQNGNALDLSGLQDGVNDADADPENEIQALSFDPTNNQLSISGSNAIIIPSGGTDADADPTNELQTISLNGNNLSLSNGGGAVDIPMGAEDQVLIFDPNTNQLSISGGNTITIPSGGVDADADPMNEIQTISLVGNTLTLSNGGGNINIPNNTDAQVLSFNPVTNELSISGGNMITIPSGGTDADADPMNEIQTLSKTGSAVTLSENGGSFTDEVNDADSDPNNEMQSINFDPVNNELSISGGNTITIPSGGTDADADPMNEIQTLSKTGSTVTLSENGGSFTDEVNDADSDPTNEIETWETLAGIPVDIADGDDVNDADSDPANELQTISFDIATNELTISGGNAISIPTGGSDADADPTNEFQNLEFNGTTLFIENGNEVNLAALQDGNQDADADPTNEYQDLQLNGTTLSIDNGNQVNLAVLQDGNQDADADPNNELQDLELNGTTLSIEGGNQVNLAVLQDGTQDADADPNNELQDLELNGTTLSIEDGNQVNLAVLQDGTQDADANPTNELQDLEIDFLTNTLSLSGSAATVNIDLLQDGDGNSSNEIQTLSFDENTNNLSISGSNTVNLPIPPEYIDADPSPNNEIQTLSFNANTNELSISGSNAVNLPIPQDDNDADPTNELQTISLNGNNLTLSNGGQVDLSGLGGSSLWDQGVGNDLYTQEDVAIGFAQSQISTLEVKEDITIRRANGNSTVDMFSSSTGGHVYLYKGNGTGASNDLLVGIDAASDGGRINVRRESGGIAGEFEVNSFDGADFNLYKPNGNAAVETCSNLFGGFASYSGQALGADVASIGYNPSDVNTGQIAVSTTSNGYRLARMNITTADESGTQAGRVEAFSSTGNRTFRLSSLTDNKSKGLLAIYDDGNPVSYMTGAPGGAIYLQESSNNRNIYIGTVSGTSNRGRIGVHGETGNTRAGIYVDDLDRGVIWGNIKNFRMDHPTDETKEIWYASVEGPEAAAYERGTAELINGEATIEFPEHFELVANHETMTVMLTPLSADCKGLAVIEKTATGFKVKELFQGTGTYRFDWEVKCVRKGYEDYQPVRERAKDQ